MSVFCRSDASTGLFLLPSLHAVLYFFPSLRSPFSARAHVFLFSPPSSRSSFLLFHCFSPFLGPLSVHRIRVRVTQRPSPLERSVRDHLQRDSHRRQASRKRPKLGSRSWSKIHRLGLGSVRSFHLVSSSPHFPSLLLSLEPRRSMHFGSISIRFHFGTKRIRGSGRL